MDFIGNSLLLTGGSGDGEICGLSSGNVFGVCITANGLTVSTSCRRLHSLQRGKNE